MYIPPLTWSRCVPEHKRMREGVIDLPKLELQRMIAFIRISLLLVSVAVVCCHASTYDLNACTYTDDKGKVYDLSPLIPKK